MNLLIKILKTIKQHRADKKQRTFCWCPICHQDLVGSESFQKDTDYVYYKCSRCGCESIWDFDMFPAPFLMKHQTLTRELKNAKEFSQPTT